MQERLAARPVETELATSNIGSSQRSRVDSPVSRLLPINEDRIKER